MPDTDAGSALPDDIAGLKAMLLAQTAELAEIRAQRHAQEAELAAARAGLIEQRFEIEALKSRLARLQRMTFGRSSEKLRDQVEQLELTLADIDEMLGEITPANDAADEPAEIPATQARSPAAARGSATRHRRASRPLCLPGLWRRPAPLRRGHHRDPGLCARLVPRHPPCPSEAVVPGVRDDCPGAGSQSADPPRSRRRGSAGACAGGEVLRPLCATNTPTAMEVWSCMRDEGGPLGVRDQERVPNHRELLLERTMVVSVAEKAGPDPVR